MWGVRFGIGVPGLEPKVEWGGGGGEGGGEGGSGGGGGELWALGRLGTGRRGSSSFACSLWGAIVLARAAQVSGYLLRVYGFEAGRFSGLGR